MKLSDLQAFVDIVDAGGLTAAAARRDVTQPALSRLLRDLETRLRAQLLRRTGRGIDLTPAGAEFLKFCAQTLDEFEDVKTRISEQVKAPPRQLRLSVPLRVGRLLIPDLYRIFGDRLPETRMQITEEPSDRARELLKDARLDAAVTYGSGSQADPGFVPMFEENLLALGNQSALGPDETAISMQHLAALPLLLPGTGRYRELIQSAFRSARQTPRIARELETAEGLLAFAAEGEGIAILPMSNIYQEIARGEISARQIDGPEITRQIGVQLGTAMSKHVASDVLLIIRAAMQKSAKTAAWRRLSGRQKKNRKGVKNGQEV